MLLDVAVNDPAKNVQLFAKAQEFFMQGFTGPNKTGEKTVDNWLIRSWDDLSLPSGESVYTFKGAIPADVSKADVKITLTYKVGDVAKEFSKFTESVATK